LSRSPSTWDCTRTRCARTWTCWCRDSGFAPELSADGSTVNLHRCPFRELAVTNPDVVCGAHLGIVQGALDDLGGLVSTTRLIPFVTPGLCVTTLTRSVTPQGL
jgi:predicted ArsR family transcriptional regulator